MYLSDLIRDGINAKLKKTFTYKEVTINDVERGTVTFQCKEVRLVDDDGDCWLEFIDTNNNTYTAEGQGIDIWFDVK